MRRFRSTRLQALALAAGLALAGLPILAFAQDTSGSDAAAGVGILFTCFCYLIGLVIEIALTYWVYTDAKKRGNPNAVLWGVLTFFLGLLGLLIYILVGRNQGTAMGGPPPAGPTGPAGPSNTVRY
jgi:apolipoprotein N-acyltransferase